MSIDPEAAKLSLEQEAKQYYWYHCVDLGNGYVTDGDYAIGDFIDHYHFPAQMDGMKVLDVGRGSGAFAFEFERRGADVTAVDLRSFFDWDFVGGASEREKRISAVNDPEAFSKREIWGGFEFAHRVRGSKVESKYVSAYDLSPGVFDGRIFDLVFAGSITSHLRDPIRALERIRSVTKTTCIVGAPSLSLAEATPITKVLSRLGLLRGLKEGPFMSLVGTVDSDRRSWWVMNESCLKEMLLCAGFSKVEIVSRFDLKNRRLPDLKYPHIVAHAQV